MNPLHNSSIGVWCVAITQYIFYCTFSILAESRMLQGNVCYSGYVTYYMVSIPLQQPKGNLKI